MLQINYMVLHQCFTLIYQRHSFQRRIMMEVMYFDVNCTCKPKKSFKRYVQFNKIAKHFDENCKIESGDNGVYRLTTSHDAAKHIEKILKIININNINAEAAKAYYDLHKGLEGSKWFSDDDSSTTHVVTDSVAGGVTPVAPV